MNRRRFLTQVATAAAGAPLVAATREAPPPSSAGGLIDTNVYLSSWVTRDYDLGGAAKRLKQLQRHGVTSAWVGSFEGVLQTDIAGVNTRLAAECAHAGGGVLRPFGTINPTLPDWEDDLRRCHETHRMPGVRLFPNYHGYTLDDARFGRLVELAAKRRLVVQIVLSIEDDRSQNPALTAAPVQVAPLADVVEKERDARIMLLNAASRVLMANSALTKRLTSAGVLFEIATLEGVAGIEALLQRVPGVRVAFGSHVPYFYFEAALLKLQESALSAAQLAAVRHANAEALLPT